MNDHDTELLLRVNGIQPAFGIEFGLADERADEGRADPYRQANVSYSLVQRREGKIIRHTLIDVGMGVVPSLLEFEVSHDVPDEDNLLLFDSDVCFLDTNTWHPVESGRHQSVPGNLRLIEKWKPKRTYFIHYSGYEDRDHGDDPINGAIGMERFREEVQRISGDHDVQPARHGMILGDDVTWPT